MFDEFTCWYYICAKFLEIPNSKDNEIPAIFFPSGLWIAPTLIFSGSMVVGGPVFSFFMTPPGVSPCTASVSHSQFLLISDTCFRTPESRTLIYLNLTFLITKNEG